MHARRERSGSRVHSVAFWVLKDAASAFDVRTRYNLWDSQRFYVGYAAVSSRWIFITISRLKRMLRIC